VLFASAIAILGFFIIPHKRLQAKTRFSEKIETVRQNLGRVLRTQFDSEADRTFNRLKEGVAPYMRFVRSERERLTSIDQTLNNAMRQVQQFNARIESVFGK
jgi:hypothetical protein